MKLYYRWSYQVPEEENPGDIAQRVFQVLERTEKYDHHLTGSDASFSGHELTIEYEYSATNKDRWYVMSRARFVIIGICVRSKIPFKELKLDCFGPIYTKRNWTRADGRYWSKKTNEEKAKELRERTI
jgi:hypothetical protein